MSNGRTAPPPIETASPDVAFEDPPSNDPVHPLGTSSIHFRRGEFQIFGSLWVAQGAARKGVVIIPPQTFGGDSLESVIFPLIRSGINVINFWPVGMWDRTQPTYSMYNAVDDVHALIDWVRSSDHDASDPLLAEYRSRLDPDRIALFGLSGGGGNVSFAACAESAYVNHAVAVSSANMDVLSHDHIREGYAGIGRPWYADAFIANISKIQERTSIIRQAKRLAAKHLLMIGASRDTAAPIEDNHKPMVAALRAAGAQHLTEVIMDTDHVFMDKRNALALLLIEWLRREASF